MESGDSKKLALLYILEILKNDSDIEHPLRQDKIAELLEKRYMITLERKAIGRNLSLLLGAGYDIVQTPAGTYLGEREFEPSELRLLIDSVLFSKHISPSHSRTLADKLSALGGKYFETHRRHAAPTAVADRNKNEYSQLFFAIEIVDEAIEAGYKISFVYSKFGADKKLHKSSDHTVSPYQMILQNQHYYLMAYSEEHDKMMFYRMDKISSVEIVREKAVPLRSLPGHEGGIDYRELSSTMPYMYGDRPIHVTFTCPAFVIDQVIDWFGYESNIRKGSAEGEYLVTVRVSPTAMEYWALQYAKYVRVVAPTDLRDRIAAALRKAADEYAESAK